MTLKRGFKADAERRAKQARVDLGLAENDGIDPRLLAEHHDVKVVEATDLVSLEALEELESLQAFAFSAATFQFGKRRIIVVNPLRTVGRQNSDISHELAHILLDHELSEIRELNGLPFRTCQPEQEEEATALGGTLLLPRPLLMSAGRRGASIETIADDYSVTVDMARFRYNTTGIKAQLARTRKK